MKEITSKDNKIYKMCKKLADKKYRTSLQKYIIEGPNLIEEALKSGVLLECVILRDGMGSIGGVDATTFAMDSRLFDEISDTVTSQGIIGVVPMPNTGVGEFFRSIAEKNVVVMDRLQDPGNIGTIIRTAEAADYGGIIAVKGSGDVYAPKTIRAAAGTVFRMPVLFAESASQAVGLLREHGFNILATCMNGDYVYYDVDLRAASALVIGNEGSGVSEELRSAADMTIQIPMAGSTESLNAAVAASIVMYESLRQKNKA